MPTTPTFAWPYPAGTDAGDVPFVMQQALEAVEATVKGPHMVRATQTGTGQTLTTATYAAVTFNTEDYDVGGLHSTVTNTSRLTIVRAGYYRFTAALVWASNATGIRKAYMLKNGTTTLVNISGTAVSGSAHSEQLSATVYMAVNDYAEVFAYQSSGGNLALDPSAGSTWFEAIWVGA